MTRDVRAYQKRWQYEASLGHRRYVDPAPVTRHVHALLATGLTARGIATLARVSPTTIARFRDGDYARAQRSVATRILAVRADAILDRPDNDGFVPRIGAVRRVQALLAIGWRHEDITAAMPTHTRAHLILSQHGPFVTRTTHDAVVAAYDALSMRPGQSDVTRKRALAAGFAPPLAWDDETIDDPAAEPQGVSDDVEDRIDEVAVERAVAGRPVRLTRAERDLALPRMAAAGMSDHVVAGLLGITPETVLRTRRRLGVPGVQAPHVRAAQGRRAS